MTSREARLARILNPNPSNPPTATSLTADALSAVTLTPVPESERMRARTPSVSLADMIANVKLRTTSSRRLFDLPNGRLRRRSRSFSPHPGELAVQANRHFRRANLPEFDSPDRLGVVATQGDGWQTSGDAWLEVLAPPAVAGRHPVGYTSFAPGDVTAPAAFDPDNPAGAVNYDVALRDTLAELRSKHQISVLGEELRGEPGFEQRIAALEASFAANSADLRAQSVPPFRGKVAIVNGGDTELLDKVANAQSAGATALVIISLFPYLEPPPLCVPRNVGDRLSAINGLPVVSVSKELGQKLLDSLADGLVLRIHVAPSLLRAVALGRADLCRDIIARDPGLLDKPDRHANGMTALWLAAQLGETALVALLLEHGADANRAGPKGYTPLMIAVMCKHVEAAEKLVDHGADVNITSPAGETVLHAAMRSGLKALVMTLLRAGADAQANDLRNNSALSWAVANGDEEMVRFLMASTSLDVNSVVLHASPASPAFGNLAPRTLLYTAVGCSHHGVMRALLAAGADPNAGSGGAYRCLHLAISNRDKTAVGLLLEHGAEVNPPATSKGWTPLHLAVHVGSASLAATLLERGADPGAVGFNNGVTVLQHAVWTNQTEIVLLLLQHGADINQTDHCNRTALYVLCDRRTAPDKTLEDLIFAANPDPRLASEPTGMNPLHLVTYKGRQGLLERILALEHVGVNELTSGNCALGGGLSALNISIMLGFGQLALQLLKHPDTFADAAGDGVPRPLVGLYATWTWHHSRDMRCQLLQGLLSTGADITQCVPGGRPVFELIEQIDQEQAVAVCRESYDCHRLCDAERGHSPLHRAALLGSQPLWELLVSMGADCEKLDREGRRPLDLVSDAGLQFVFKQLVGRRDVMISYSHTDQALAFALRDYLEAQKIPTWIDQMTPTGISGGAVWRDEIGQAIGNSCVVLALLSRRYQQSKWCMKELLLAKQLKKHVVPVTCEAFEADMTEELKMHIYAHQIVPLHDLVSASDKTVDRVKLAEKARRLLDGIRTTIELDRVARKGASTEEASSTQHLGVDGSGAGGGMVGGGPLLRSVSEEVAIAEMCTGVKAKAEDCRRRGRPYIFVAHGSCNLPFVRELVTRLRNGVGEVDVIVAPESEDADESSAVHEAIKDAALFVPVLSTESAHTHELRDQLAFAEDKERVLLPVYVGAFAMPAGFSYQLAAGAGVAFVKGRPLSLQQSATGIMAAVRERLQLPAADEVQRLEQELAGARAEIARLQAELQRVRNGQP